MKQDLNKYLPPEIFTAILSSDLPLRTIAISKCVCRSWRDFLNSDPFIYSHLGKSKSKSSLSLALISRSTPASCCCHVFQFANELDDFNINNHQLFKFDFLEKSAAIVGAADGLLLISKLQAGWIRVRKVIYICNPITREYVKLRGPNPMFCPPVGAYGFGASRISRQYKVVMINHSADCLVYTLGKGSWRRVGVGVGVEEARDSLLLLLNDHALSSAFLHGNLHWAIKNVDNPLITCFDLETECFSTLRAPAFGLGGDGTLSILRGCLCLCFCDWEDGELVVVVWLMKEYGVEKSWSKDYVIMRQSQVPPHDYVYGNLVYPIKVFENGDVLMLFGDKFVVYYSDKTRICEAYGLFDRDLVISSMPFAPSFLSLQRLGIKNVVSF